MKPMFAIGGDMPVSRLGFGAMHLTGPGVWGPPADRAGAIAVARRAVELGVTFIDTADAYGPGSNEELLAEALHPYRGDLVIGTKAGRTRPSRTEWTILGRPEYLRQQAELSLRRLRVPHIDLFQLHRVDPHVPFADQIGALARLKEEGKVRHVGLSEVSVDEIVAAGRIVEIASVQNVYNLETRGHEAVLEHCDRHGIAFIAWLPIASGAHAEARGPLGDVARELGKTPAQVALAWLLRRSRVVIPIPGTQSAAHLEENVAAADIELSDSQFELLTRNR